MVPPTIPVVWAHDDVAALWLAVATPTEGAWSARALCGTAPAADARDALGGLAAGARGFGCRAVLEQPSAEWREPEDEEGNPLAEGGTW